MRPPPRLVLASGNPGKLRELRAIVPGWELLDLRALGLPDAVEPGEDYVTNARAKALAASRASGLPALADDSGLEVDALDGQPGWRSAHFAGAHGDTPGNRALLLRVMAGVPTALRAARFHCAVAFADATGPLGERTLVGLGVCAGRVVTAPRGELGFGYDPLLELRGMSETIAELPDAFKNERSHRGAAVRAIRPAVEAYLRERLRP